jgi:hypothetical protein
MGLVCIMLLLAGNARAEAWKCAMVESHHFVQGRDIAQRGGGDFLIQVKPPVINLMANGHFIIDYGIVENSRFRLFGEKHTDLGGGESRTARLTLDKVHGRISQSGISHKGDSDELEEMISGRCSEASN